MVLVPVGSFVKGTPLEAVSDLAQQCMAYLSETDCRSLFADEVPAYNTSIRDPFWLDRFEVTNGQFAESGGSAAAPAESRDPSQPRSNITWLEAQNFCESRGMRLPTETEWEYAARGPESRVYPWGNDFPGAIMNYCDASCQYESWRDNAHNDGFPFTAPVGSLTQSVSWVGAEDMAGNLWEWTSTIYREDAQAAYEDPADLNAQRTLKGGSWNWVLHETRGAARSAPANRTPSSPWYGFRCARDFNLADLEGLGR
jgi:formylglycine-generating enzyme required for sulfatase activity